MEAYAVLLWPELHLAARAAQDSLYVLSGQVSLYTDCHSVRLPLDCAPMRSTHSYFRDDEVSMPYVQGQVKRQFVIAPAAKLFAGFDPLTGAQLGPYAYEKWNGATATHHLKKSARLH